jgi:hypothetical protein
MFEPFLSILDGGAEIRPESVISDEVIFSVSHISTVPKIQKKYGITL